MRSHPLELKSYFKYRKGHAMTIAHVISNNAANQITDLLEKYRQQEKEKGDIAFAAELYFLIGELEAGKVNDALASIAVKEIASGDAAYCIWVEEELNGCPHDAVTDIAKSAGSRVIDERQFALLRHYCCANNKTLDFGFLFSWLLSAAAPSGAAAIISCTKCRTRIYPSYHLHPILFCQLSPSAPHQCHYRNSSLDDYKSDQSL